ncbi:hypothetical protein TNIN_439541 [Trichonephila inaurata madagascariensis]|uniref:Uncharacterized protein n=1 Tax=Trichonephila inaurata madagascariensis TaxID=2747483 RepID=A0A8X6YBX8_9ARAC|nr:hypothetical protein TNIN_439541 [Trichonephila inaurata madagascariensis]
MSSEKDSPPTQGGVGQPVSPIKDGERGCVLGECQSITRCHAKLWDGSYCQVTASHVSKQWFGPRQRVRYISRGLIHSPDLSPRMTTGRIQRTKGKEILYISPLPPLKPSSDIFLDYLFPPFFSLFPL